MMSEELLRNPAQGEQLVESLSSAMRTVFTPWKRIPFVTQTWEEVPSTMRIFRRLLPKAVILGCTLLAIDLLLLYVLGGSFLISTASAQIALVVWFLSKTAYIWFAVHSSRVGYEYVWSRNEAVRTVPMVFRERFHSMQLAFIAAMAAAEFPRTAITLWQGIIPLLAEYHAGGNLFGSLMGRSPEALVAAFAYTMSVLAGLAASIGFLCLIFIISTRRRGHVGPGPRASYAPVAMAVLVFVLGTCVGSCGISIGGQPRFIGWFSNVMPLVATTLIILPVLRNLWLKEYVQARRELFRDEA